MSSELESFLLTRNIKIGIETKKAEKRKEKNVDF